MILSQFCTPLLPSFHCMHLVWGNNPISLSEQRGSNPFMPIFPLRKILHLAKYPELSRSGMFQNRGLLCWAARMAWNCCSQPPEALEVPPEQTDSLSVSYFAAPTDVSEPAAASGFSSKDREKGPVLALGSLRKPTLPATLHCQACSPPLFRASCVDHTLKFMLLSKLAHLLIYIDHHTQKFGIWVAWRREPDFIQECLIFPPTMTSLHLHTCMTCWPPQVKEGRDKVPWALSVYWGLNI